MSTQKPKKYPTAKLVKAKPTPEGGKVYTYRHPIIAGMQFTYPGTRLEALRHVGHYDYEIVVDHKGQTLSERKLQNIFFTTPKALQL